MAGLGAFELWAMSNGLIESIQGKLFADLSSTMDQFWRELTASNQRCINLYLSSGGDLKNIELLEGNVETGWDTEQ